MRNEVKAAIEYVVEVMEDIRERIRTLGLGCLISAHTFPCTSRKYRFVASFLLSQPIFPPRPSITPTDSKQTIEGLLPLGWRGRHKTSLPGVSVAKILQRSPIRRIVIPNGQFEQDST